MKNEKSFLLNKVNKNNLLNFLNFEFNWSSIYIKACAYLILLLLMIFWFLKSVKVGAGGGDHFRKKGQLHYHLFLLLHNNVFFFLGLAHQCSKAIRCRLLRVSPVLRSCVLESLNHFACDLVHTGLFSLVCSLTWYQNLFSNLSSWFLSFVLLSAVGGTFKVEIHFQFLIFSSIKLIKNWLISWTVVSAKFEALF